jgi:hypothetical protein
MRLPACWGWLAEEASAETETIPSMAIGEKAEVAHAVEAVRKHMKEKASDKFVGMKTHDLLTVATIATVILPSEGNMVVIGIDDAAVGDGDTMGVAAEIGEHLVRPAEWRLRIDDPFDTASTREMARERIVVVEMAEVVGEAEFTVSEGFSKSG